MINLDSKGLEVKYAREPKLWLQRLDRDSRGEYHWNFLLGCEPMSMHMEVLKRKLVQTGWCAYTDIAIRRTTRKRNKKGRVYYYRHYRIVTAEKLAEPVPMALVLERKSGIFGREMVHPANLFSRDWLIQFLVRHAVNMEALYIGGSLVLTRDTFNKLTRECDPISIVGLV